MSNYFIRKRRINWKLFRKIITSSSFYFMAFCFGIKSILTTCTKKIVESTSISLKNNTVTYDLIARTCYKNRNHFTGFYYVNQEWIYYDDMNLTSIKAHGSILPKQKISKNNMYSLWFYSKRS